MRYFSAGVISFPLPNGAGQSRDASRYQNSRRVSFWWWVTVLGSKLVRSGNDLHSYWKWPIEIGWFDLLIKNDDFPYIYIHTYIYIYYIYVSLPEGSKMKLSQFPDIFDSDSIFDLSAILWQTAKCWPTSMICRFFCDYSDLLSCFLRCLPSRTWREVLFTGRPDVGTSGSATPKAAGTGIGETWKVCWKRSQDMSRFQISIGSMNHEEGWWRYHTVEIYIQSLVHHDVWCATFKNQGDVSRWQILQLMAMNCGKWGLPSGKLT